MRPARPAASARFTFLGEPVRPSRTPANVPGCLEEVPVTITRHRESRQSQQSAIVPPQGCALRSKPVLVPRSSRSPALHAAPPRLRASRHVPRFLRGTVCTSFMHRFMHLCRILCIICTSLCSHYTTSARNVNPLAPFFAKNFAHLAAAGESAAIYGDNLLAKILRGARNVRQLATPLIPARPLHATPRIKFGVFVHEMTANYRLPRAILKGNGLLLRRRTRPALPFSLAASARMISRAARVPLQLLAPCLAVPALFSRGSLCPALQQLVASGFR